MRISVTTESIFVRPHFPFSLIGKDMDLIHEIPIRSVVDVKNVSVFGKGAIAVQFATPDGLRRIDLMLGHAAEFLSLVSRRINESGVPNQSTDPTFSSGTPGAGHQSRHP